MDDEGDDGFSNPASGVVLELEERNRLADECIKRCTIEHCAKDAALSSIGYVPLPLAGFAGMAAGIALQVPLYKRMAKGLGDIYLASPEEIRSIKGDIFVPQIVNNAAIDFAGELTTELLAVILGESAGELLGGAVTSIIPIPWLSGAVGTYFDIRIARKMTRRFGLMTCIFYQNEARWVGGDRDATFRAAKNMKGDADDVRRENPEVKARHVQRAKSIMAMLMQMPGATREQVREIMIERNVPPDIIDEAMGSI